MGIPQVNTGKAHFHRTRAEGQAARRGRGGPEHQAQRTQPVWGASSVLMDSPGVISEVGRWGEGTPAFQQEVDPPVSG